MIEATMEQLLLMKLFGMTQGLKEQMDNPEYRNLGFEERLGILVDKEKLYRENRLLKTLASKAHFRHPNACFENIDFRTRRGITKEGLFRLCQNDWIKNRHNLIIVGPTGVGKTFIACALGTSAIRSGISALYVRMPRFVQELKVARADGSYVKLLQRLQRIKLLVIDEQGVEPVYRRGTKRPSGNPGGPPPGSINHYHKPDPHRYVARRHRGSDPG